ncbi:MAG: GTPase HflX [Clostridiales Family XIII bacterium]|nr:GTPase HflX [Clostridiales Family XIII bacterium]
MEENKQPIQKAVLVAVDTGAYDVDASLAELWALAESAGAEVLATASQKRASFDRATLVGSGRIEEIREAAAANDANLIIFDHELTATQIRNISKIVEMDVIDRTMLILDIFAGRALTKEGRLQVELAQQRYRLPRLGGQGLSLSRLGGGIGTRGPGETKLEADRRHIRRRIQILETQLKELEGRRAHKRARRKKDGVTMVAIVGYTNVGKSTLLNTLTDAGVLAEDKLFATLDPAARKLSLPNGRDVMLVDTVGLIRRLPHQLVKAFLSTLEEAAYADLILNVCDASSADAEEQIAVTQTLMAQLGVRDTPMVTVRNKIDKLAGQIPIPGEGKEVPISARTGAGIDNLLRAVEGALEPSQIKIEFLLPYSKGGLLAEIRESGKILEETFTEDGTRAVALADQKILHKITPYKIDDGDSGACG